MLYICMVCNKPIDDEPHDGSMVGTGKSRHWKCRPDANIPTMTFSEAIQGLRDAAKNLTEDQCKQLSDKLRKILK